MRTMCSREIFTKKCRQQQIFDSDLQGARDIYSDRQKFYVILQIDLCVINSMCQTYDKSKGGDIRELPFTRNGRREFVPRDQVIPLFSVYSLFLLHRNKQFYVRFNHRNRSGLFLCAYFRIKKSDLKSRTIGIVLYCCFYRFLPFKDKNEQCETIAFTRGKFQHYRLLLFDEI